MMGISWMELLVIAMVALLVIGPRELPAALRTLGRGLRTIRRMAREFQSQVDQVIRESEIDTVRQDFEESLRGMDAKQPAAADGQAPEAPAASAPGSAREAPEQAQSGTGPGVGPDREGHP